MAIVTDIDVTPRERQNLEERLQRLISMSDRDFQRLSRTRTATLDKNPEEVIAVRAAVRSTWHAKAERDGKLRAGKGRG